ncbi:MAG: hypothetical protein KDD38_08710 [Bdellovibrionales bacterium]|nr:hypothetical protein [Bdellovibrionales bacterium]
MVITCFSFAQPANASTSLKCTENLYVLFINGVFNNRRSAKKSHTALLEFLKESDLQSTGLRWTSRNTYLVYNYSGGFLDLLEAYNQKEGEIVSNFWLWLTKLPLSPKWFQERYISEMRKIDNTSSTYTVDQGLENFINEIIIMGGGKILIVAHSQGNFFAQSAIIRTRNSLIINWESDQQKARWVAIATPTATAPENNAFTTLKSDGVIKAIPLSLPGNITNTIPKPGLFDHEFVKHYLNGDGASKQIRRQIRDEISKLSLIGKSTNDQACDKWFEKNYDQSIGIKECIQACNTYPIDTSTFHCRPTCTSSCNCKF